MKNLSEAQRKQMLAISTDKKWVLVKQDMLQKPTQIGHHQDKKAPEYYIRKIMENAATVKMMNSLSVSLRTAPIT